MSPTLFDKLDNSMSMATEERIDFYPTHEVGGVRFRRGRPLPFGATIVPNGVNFSVFSSAADSCTLVLFHKHEPGRSLKSNSLGNSASAMSIP